MAGIAWSENYTRLSILGSAAALLLVIVGILAYRIYDARVGRPQTTILNVAGTKISLGYFAARLGPFAVENQNSRQDVSALAESLLTKMEREIIVEKLALERGVTLGDGEVTEFIAKGFGVPVGGTGSSFDSLYRNQLRTLRISDTNFRKLKRAELADDGLAKTIENGLGDRIEQYTLRVILSNSQESAAGLLARVKAGEDFGSLAQKESLDLESRQQDGILPPEPIELLPESVRNALAAAKPGDLAGPVQVEANWWVIKVEVKEQADLSIQQKTQVAESRRDELIKAKRAELASKIKRSFDADDLRWASSHVRVSQAGARNP